MLLEVQIRDFLISFKETMHERGLDMVPRAKNNQAIQRLGLTMSNVREIIFGLGLKNYCKGPKSDRDKPGEIWVFGTTIDGEEVYIKLKLAITEGKHIAKCISFHMAERPLFYRYSERRELELHE